MPTSNVLKLLVGILFIIFIALIGIFLLLWIRNDNLGPEGLSAIGLTPSDSTIKLVGPDVIGENETEYKIVIDAKGEQMTSYSIEIEYPSKDISIVAEKGDIAMFNDGVFVPTANVSTGIYKLTGTTQEGKVFSGSNLVLAKLYIKKVSTSTAKVANIRFLEGSYHKYKENKAKAFIDTSTVKNTYAIFPNTDKNWIPTTSSSSISSSSSTSVSTSVSTSKSSSVSTSASTSKASSSVTTVSTTKTVTSLPSTASTSQFENLLLYIVAALTILGLVTYAYYNTRARNLLK